MSNTFFDLLNIHSQRPKESVGGAPAGEDTFGEPAPRTKEPRAPKPPLDHMEIKGAPDKVVEATALSNSGRSKVNLSGSVYHKVMDKITPELRQKVDPHPKLKHLGHVNDEVHTFLHNHPEKNVRDGWRDFVKRGETDRDTMGHFAAALTHPQTGLVPPSGRPNYSHDDTPEIADKIASWSNKHSPVVKDGAVSRYKGTKLSREEQDELHSAVVGAIKELQVDGSHVDVPDNLAHHLAPSKQHLSDSHKAMGSKSKRTAHGAISTFLSSHPKVGEAWKNNQIGQHDWASVASVLSSLSRSKAADGLGADPAEIRDVARKWAGEARKFSQGHTVNSLDDNGFDSMLDWLSKKPTVSRPAAHVGDVFSAVGKRKKDPDTEKRDPEAWAEARKRVAEEHGPLPVGDDAAAEEYWKKVRRIYGRLKPDTSRAAHSMIETLGKEDTTVNKNVDQTYRQVKDAAGRLSDPKAIERQLGHMTQYHREIGAHSYFQVPTLLATMIHNRVGDMLPDGENTSHIRGKMSGADAPPIVRNLYRDLKHLHSLHTRPQDLAEAIVNRHSLSVIPDDQKAEAVQKVAEAIGDFAHAHHKYFGAAMLGVPRHGMYEFTPRTNLGPGPGGAPLGGPKTHTMLVNERRAEEGSQDRVEPGYRNNANKTIERYLSAKMNEVHGTPFMKDLQQRAHDAGARHGEGRSIGEGLKAMVDRLVDTHFQHPTRKDFNPIASHGYKPLPEKDGRILSKDDMKRLEEYATRPEKDVEVKKDIHVKPIKSPDELHDLIHGLGTSAYKFSEDPIQMSGANPDEPLMRTMLSSASTAAPHTSLAHLANTLARFKGHFSGRQFQPTNRELLESAPARSADISRSAGVDALVHGIRAMYPQVRINRARELARYLHDNLVDTSFQKAYSLRERVLNKKEQLIEARKAQENYTVGDLINDFVKSESVGENIQKRIFKSTLRGQIKKLLYGE